MAAQITDEHIAAFATESTWDDPAYTKMRACFAEGVYAYDHYNWNEGPPGVQGWSCAFYKSEPLYRRMRRRGP